MPKAAAATITTPTAGHAAAPPEEAVLVADLKPHPRNYRSHPDDQLAHIVESIRANGVYKNVVVSRDGFVLAGHGVYLAALKGGVTELPARRLPYDHQDPRAIKVLIGDNEVWNLGMPDDRQLTELLKQVRDADSLLGTGFDDQQFAALAFVTRPASELATVDEAKEWVGMPSFEPAQEPFKVIVLIQTEAERDKFLASIGAKVFGRKEGKTWSLWWPPRAEKRDVVSLRFKSKDSPAPAPRAKAKGKRK